LYRRQNIPVSVTVRRFGHDLENWALFEPFRIIPVSGKSISIDDPIFREALDLLGLKLTSGG
jgi:hypothetical protein